MTEPVALAIHKHDRWCVVGKITSFEGDTTPILAVAWKGQHGTTAAISMPAVALDYARQRGVKWFFLRDDRARRMWALPLAAFWRGRLHADGEYYVPRHWLEEVPWRDWHYAERTVRLERPPAMATPVAQTDAGAVQLQMFEVAA